MDNLPGIGSARPSKRGFRRRFRRGTALQFYSHIWNEEHFEPNTGHRQAHLAAGETPCDQSQMEYAAWERIHRYGKSLDGWKYKSRRGVYFSDCDTEGPVEPTLAHYRRHCRAKTKVCERANAERSLHRHFGKRGTVEGWQDPRFVNRLKHIVYRVEFLNGDQYVGITCIPLEERLVSHCESTSNVGMRLLSDELYHAEVLCELPNRMEARKVEELIIKSGNPKGRLLNIHHNPWKGLPAPHWGAV